ncbi:MAG: DNA polymerase III subunit alpha [bacterium]
MTEFVHLHNHSHYSLLDGVCKLDDFVSEAVKNDMPALALTDHGNMFGAIEFYQVARKHGVKPIIGVEAYVAPGSRKERKYSEGSAATSFHLVLLAKSLAGYQNLMRLVSIGFLEGFYYRPRMDKEVLKQYSEGLIALSACLKGEVSYTYLKKGYDAARKIAQEYLEIFKDDYYLEIQNHGIKEEDQAREGIIELSKDLSIPIVATNDVHYLRKDHYLPHDCLICLQTGKDRDDPKRLRYSTNEIYFKSQQEMAETFPGYEDALKRTQEVAGKCNVELNLKVTYLPKFEIPEDEPAATLDDYLAKLAYEGARERFGEITPQVEERLQHELGIIKEMGYSGYFLIVMDFIRYAKQQGIPVGPGRGSAAGSLVSYCLQVTNIDPLKYNLIFERFLNPERVTMPDIDIDFCYERREEIIQYVKEKYGEKNVTQIITFGTMAARAVIRDVGRVLKISYSDVDRIAKMIPASPKMTLEKAFELVPDLLELADENETYQQLIDYSRVLEGLARHASTHAAGVVITPDDLTNYTPLYRSSQGDITTQYDMKILERIGVLKMDFLGLRTLTVIQKAVDALAEKGIEVDINRVDLEDKETYELFSRGETVAVFQFESSGMREYLRKLKPQVFDDLIAMNALYRPGPMDWIDDFIARRQGRKTIEYLHPLLEPILEETYGIIVYQEQVMRIASTLAGFSMGKADLLRSAMGKKKKKLMAEQRVLFLQGCAERQIPEKLANEIFDLMDKFAGYGFVKPHATCYAHVAFQTAYLKRHYPAEFMAATISSEMGSTNRVVILIEECKRMGITVKPPDVNESFYDFKVEGKEIRFGLGAIKNVGKNAIESIINSRQRDGRFTSIFEFCERVDSRQVNKKVLESLIQAGAMDSLEGHRAQKLAAIETAINFAQSAQAAKIRRQTSIFDLDDANAGVASYPMLPMVSPWKDSHVLALEKEILGFYVSGHPLDKFNQEVRTFATVTLEAIHECKDGTEVRVCGIVTESKNIFDRKNKPMAFVTLEDFHGSVEIIVFSSVYEDVQQDLQPDSMVVVTGRVSTREQEPAKILCESVVPLLQAWEEFGKSLYLSMNVIGVDDPLLNQVSEILKQNPGGCNLFINLNIPEKEPKTIKSKNLKVKPSVDMLTKLRNLLGQENVWMEG